MLNRLICWWFGCVPDYDAIHYDESGWSDSVPCGRCGAEDTDYGDRVGDTRHNKTMCWFRYWLFRRWWPAKCHDCGNRFGSHSECLPF